MRNQSDETKVFKNRKADILKKYGTLPPNWQKATPAQLENYVNLEALVTKGELQKLSSDLSTTFVWKPFVENLEAFLKLSKTLPSSIKRCPLSGDIYLPKPFIPEHTFKEDDTFLPALLSYVAAYSTDTEALVILMISVSSIPALADKLIQHFAPDLSMHDVAYVLSPEK